MVRGQRSAADRRRQAGSDRKLPLPARRRVTDLPDPGDVLVGLCRAAPQRTTALRARFIDAVQGYPAPGGRGYVWLFRLAVTAALAAGRIVRESRGPESVYRLPPKPGDPAPRRARSGMPLAEFEAQKRRGLWSIR